MRFFNSIRLLALATVATVSVVAAQTPYDEGQKALREQDWLAAAEHFQAAFDGEHADAAMYWRAHALYKAQRTADAARQVRDLERAHPGSPWLEEARALQVEYQGARPDEQADEELRLFALSRLMVRNPDRAMPLILDIMRETESPRIRRDALFLLGINGSPEALDAIVEVARNSDDARFQAQAIEMLGVAETPESLQLLASLYSESADYRVRQAVIQAHIIAEAAGPLLEFLREETDPRLQKSIIHALGAMQAAEALGELYRRFDDRSVRGSVIEAMMISEDGEGLMRILENEKDPVLRARAIEMLGVHGGDGVGEFLVRLYPTASPSEQRAVIQSMMIQENAHGLIELLGHETDPQRRRQILEMLTAMDSPEVEDYLFEMLEGED